MLRYNLQPYFGFYMNDLTAASSLPRAPAWTHLLFQFTGQRQEIWINGKLDAARDSTGYRGQQGEMLVGKPPSWHNVPAAHWHGALRSLRIYGRALSPAEIEQLSKEQPTKGKPS
jgi:hypothetical protein